MSDEVLKPRVFDPPGQDDAWKTHGVQCRLPAEGDEESCGFRGEAMLKADVKLDGTPLAECPYCGGGMVWDISQMRFGIKMAGPGFHSTKVGQKRKREMIARNERLAKTQWENHEPVKVADPDRVKNATPGGVYDPNSRFASKKAKPIVNVGKSSSGESV